MQEAGFEEVEACVLRRQNTAAWVHCNEPNSGPPQGNVADSGDVGRERWWYKEVLDLVGAFYY